MYPYQRPQNSLLFDLIREANPDLGVPLSIYNCYFGTPKAQSVPQGGIANTNITVFGTGGKYVGKKIVEYRRIELSRLFRGMTPLEISLYSTDGPNLTISQASIVNWINNRFGLTLGANDITLTTNIGPNAITTVNVLSTSLCYTGSLSFIWRPIGPDINTVFTGEGLGGRLFDGGNDFSPGFKPVGDYICYDLDFNPIIATMNAITVSGVWANTVNAIAVLNFLKANVSTVFDNLSHTVPGGLNGLSFVKQALPIATAPEANSQHATFKNALVLTAKEDSWFRGKFIMHYTP